ncbi:hypothetical protein [Rheinheimera texasensis]|uniref:hypothetical protein n=1 Tax=Rheinheimera texasensis TaxID=306205 RepID=UPI0004E26300|nr:hypothetical protein [Rheinheimera texasensis]
MSLQLQAAATLWPANTTGVSGNLSALQQSAGDKAEHGNELASEFAAAMQQSQVLQQQLRSAPAEAEQAEAGAITSSQNGQSVSGSSQTRGSSGNNTGDESNSEPNSEQAQKFLDGLMEQLLANRLGINKKEMDRLKEKIAELELKRKELADQMNKGGNDQNLGNSIRQIDQQITALEKQLQQLVRENELSKNNPDDDKRREWSAQSLGQSA